MNFIFLLKIHPSRKYFAVAEKGIKPNINIFEYSSLKLYRVLREGTEEAYSNLDFSPDGSMLASVGSAPDFMLTVWDWKNEKILLRYKAFSQDIYKVAFSAENEGHVNTSGSGHIRQVLILEKVFTHFCSLYHLICFNIISCSTPKLFVCLFMLKRKTLAKGFLC